MANPRRQRFYGLPGKKPGFRYFKRRLLRRTREKPRLRRAWATHITEDKESS